MRNDCDRCHITLSLDEGEFRARVEYEPKEPYGFVFCYVDSIWRADTKELVSEELFDKLKERALAEAQEQCREREEGRRDGAEEAKYGHARL